MAGNLRVGDALADPRAQEVGPDELAPFNRDGRLLLNINTPDDYDRARAETIRDDPPREKRRTDTAIAI
jgi:hypothetical protein